MYPARVIAIRAAVRTDAPLLLAYVGKKSEFDRATGAFTGVLRTTREKSEATLFGEPRFAHALVAEDAGGPRGFAPDRELALTQRTEIQRRVEPADCGAPL